MSAACHRHGVFLREHDRRNYRMREVLRSRHKSRTAALAAREVLAKDSRGCGAYVRPLTRKERGLS